MFGRHQSPRRLGTLASTSSRPQASGSARPSDLKLRRPQLKRPLALIASALAATGGDRWRCWKSGTGRLADANPCIVCIICLLPHLISTHRTCHRLLRKRRPRHCLVTHTCFKMPHVRDDPVEMQAGVHLAGSSLVTLRVMRVYTMHEGVSYGICQRIKNFILLRSSEDGSRPRSRGVPEDDLTWRWCRAQGCASACLHICVTFASCRSPEAKRGGRHGSRALSFT